jgi:CBS domain-containing protein
MRLAQYFEHAYDPKTLTVRQIMEGVVCTVSPETREIAIAEIMSERNFGAVPVVERDSTLVGLVSEFDLLRAIDEGKDLRQIMAEDMLVQDFIKLLQQQHLIRTPVVKGNRLVGIATRRDAVFAYVKVMAPYWRPRKGGDR